MLMHKNIEGRMTNTQLNRAASETGDPLLLTPGPLTTSKSVKEVMVHDWGSRDATKKFLILRGAKILCTKRQKIHLLIFIKSKLF